MFIIYYHNVVPEPLDLVDRSCSRIGVQAFSKQMHFLREHYHPISLDELADGLDAGEGDPRKVAVTFDDAYAGVGTWARPILKGLSIPAAVFAVTSTLRDPEGLLHFEELEVAVRQTRVSEMGVPDLGISPRSLASERGRAAFLKKVKAALKELPEEQRRACQAEILQNLDSPAEGLGLRADRQRLAKITAEQLKELHRDPWWTVGAHTRTHKVLSRLELDQARDEISGSRQDLGSLLQSEPTWFAYPYGKPKHVGESLPQFVEDLGFRGALTTEAGVNRPEQPRFRLRRGEFIDLLAASGTEIQAHARRTFLS